MHCSLNFTRQPQTKTHKYIFSFKEPRDYQESLRKSPGVPHDPERQPNGGVLKRRTNAQHQQASKLVGPSKKSKKGLSPRVLL